MNNIIRSRMIVAGVFVLLGTGSLLHAEGDWEKGACKADAEKLCAGVQPGHGAIMQCLKQHEAELSAGCKSNMAMVKEKMQDRKEELKSACAADQQQFCKDVTPGEGREFACLHAHSDKLSAGCKEAMMKKKHHRGMKGMHGKKMKMEDGAAGGAEHNHE